MRPDLISPSSSSSSGADLRHHHHHQPVKAGIEPFLPLSSVACWNFSVGNRQLGEFYSPNYGLHYPSKTECIHLITDPSRNWTLEPVERRWTPYTRGRKQGMGWIQSLILEAPGSHTASFNRQLQQLDTPSNGSPSIAHSPTTAFEALGIEEELQFHMEDDNPEIDAGDNLLNEKAERRMSGEPIPMQRMKTASPALSKDSGHAPKISAQTGYVSESSISPNHSAKPSSSQELRQRGKGR